MTVGDDQRITQDGASGDECSIEAGKDKTRISRAPGKLWICIMVLLGLFAIGLQGVGLHTLARFSSLQEQWKAETDQRQSVRAEWDKLLDQLKGEIEQAKVQIVALQAKKTADMDENNVAQQQLRKTQQLLAIARNALEQSLTKEERASRATALAGEEQTRLQEEIARLVAQKSSSEKELSTIHTNVTRFTNTLDNLTSRIQSATTHLESIEEDVADSRQLLSQTDQTVRIERESLASLFQQKEAVQSSLLQLEQQKQVAERMITQAKLLRDENAVQAEHLESTKREFERTRTQLAQMQENLQREQHRLEKAQDDLERLRAIRHETDRKVSESAGGLAEIGREISHLTSQRDSLRSELARLNADAEKATELQSKVSARRAELVALEQRIKEARETEAALAENILALAKSIASEKTNSSASDSDNTSTSED